MKDEFSLFKDEKVPRDYVAAHMGLFNFIKRAFEGNVYISSRISIYPTLKNKMYLNVEGTGFPQIDINEIHQFRAGQHPCNLKFEEYDEEGNIKEVDIPVYEIPDDMFISILKQNELNCKKVSPLLYLFKKFADKFLAFEERYKSETFMTCFAKLGDVWFSNAGAPWSYTV